MKGKFRGSSGRSRPFGVMGAVRSGLWTHLMSCAPRCWGERDKVRSSVILPGEAGLFLMLLSSVRVLFPSILSDAAILGVGSQRALRYRC